MQYVYLIFYALVNDNGHRGESNTEISLEEPLTTIVQIRAIESQLLERHRKTDRAVRLLYIAPPVLFRTEDK